MPINNITQTISTLPPAGRRGIDVQTQFVIKQEDFQDHLQGTTVTELNTLKDQLNSRIGEINSTVTTMNGYANTASAGASTATTKAGEASTSAGEALAYRNQAETFKNNASSSATSASTSASTATTQASQASTSASTATTQAGIATTKANEASASATSASTSASTATTQAGIASTKASEASASATSASTSRNEAETFAQQAQASAASVDVNNIQTQLNAKLGIYSNAVSATKLFTPRLIGGVNFDGTANINLPGVNAKGNQDTSGTAENANKLIGKNWYWNEQGGQPTWVWGGTDGTNMYVYNPSNFNVNYANTCWRANDLGNHQWDSKSTNGYIRLSTGLIIQWGVFTNTASSVAITFPLAFPSDCVNVIASTYYSGDTGGLNTITSGTSSLPSKTGVEFTTYSNTSAKTYWTAIGY